MTWVYSYLQINDANRILKNRWINTFKYLLTAVVFVYIGNVLFDRHSDLTGFSGFHGYDWSLAVIAFALMPVNWYLEVRKWEILTSQLGNNFNQSLKQVFSGLSLNWIMPFTAGDILARLGDFRNLKQKTQSLAVNRFSSLLITSIFGVIGILQYLKLHQDIEIGLGSYLTLFVFMGISISVLAFKYPNAKSVVLYTVVRYLVFTLQFYLLISIFNPSLDSKVIVYGIFWTFFIRSVIPGILGSIGIREASAWLYFSFFISDPSLIMMPSLMLWIINLVIPSIVGGVLMLKS